MSLTAGSIRSSKQVEQKFHEADQVMQTTFLEQNIDADLSPVLDMGFSAEAAIDTETNKVLGAVLFVFMNQYLWIEDIVVSTSSQKHGIGSSLISRMHEIATSRKKDILLYAIDSAIPFYQRAGFTEQDRYSTKYKVFRGKYMVWTSPLVDQFVEFQI